MSHKITGITDGKFDAGSIIMITGKTKADSVKSLVQASFNIELDLTGVAVESLLDNVASSKWITIQSQLRKHGDEGMKRFTNAKCHWNMVSTYFAAAAADKMREANIAFAMKLLKCDRATAEKAVDDPETYELFAQTE